MRHGSAGSPARRGPARRARPRRGHCVARGVSRALEPPSGRPAEAADPAVTTHARHVAEACAGAIGRAHPAGGQTRGAEHVRHRGLARLPAGTRHPGEQATALDTELRQGGRRAHPRMRFPAAANGNSPAPDQMTQPVARQSTAAVPMPGPAADGPAAVEPRARPGAVAGAGREPAGRGGGRGSRRPHRLPRPARATAAGRPRRRRRPLGHARAPSRSAAAAARRARPRCSSSGSTRGRC